MVYINATIAISPHETFLSNHLPINCKDFSEPLKWIKPNFKNYFSSLEARRTNTLIKTAHICAVETLKAANFETPDAIITASGLGCIQSTERFLNDILNTSEGLLAPTSFIQSTANAIGGHHAIQFKCNGYNVLHAQKSFSFENALLDSILQLESNAVSNVLLGGFDEITEENYKLKQQTGIFKKSPFSNQNIAQSNTSCSIPGEGSSYFFLSNQKGETPQAEIKNIWMHNGSIEQKEVSEWICSCLKEEKLSPSQIDIVLAGYNGDKKNNTLYNQILDSTFASACNLSYKQLCGEYDTACAFGMWVATKILGTNSIPNYLRLNDCNPEFKNVLLLHQVDYSAFSLILLTPVN